MSRQKKKAHGKKKKKMLEANKQIGHGIKKAPGKRKILARKEKCSRYKKMLVAKKKKVTAKEKSSRQKKITYGEKKKIAAKEKLLQQRKVTHRKRQQNAAKGNEKNIIRSKILRKEKKKYFANFFRLLRLLCSTAETLICCSK